LRRYTLATYKFTPEQIVDPMLKILTGYHLIDGDMRQLAVEAGPARHCAPH
jgi:hypothetical protein